VAGDALDSRAIHRDKMAQLGELTAGIAHELNNPIGYIASNLNTLRRYAQALDGLLATPPDGLDAAGLARWQERLQAARWDYIRGDLPALIDETRQGADHLTHLVADLKALSRTSVAAEPLVVDDCVASALAVLGHQLKHRFRVTREAAAPEPLPAVRSQVIQLVINLVHNAIQAQAAGGALRVATAQAGGVTTITVEDSGPGVPEADRRRIFEAFVSGKPDGTGLGLAIVARIAGAHGGDAQCDASPALGGARFRVTLRGLAAPPSAGQPAAPGVRR
jgi:two-component system NtrC family sensor kinase